MKREQRTQYRNIESIQDRLREVCGHHQHSADSPAITENSTPTPIQRMESGMTLSLRFSVKLATPLIRQGKSDHFFFSAQTVHYRCSKTQESSRCRFQDGKKDCIAKVKCLENHTSSRDICFLFPFLFIYLFTQRASRRLFVIGVMGCVTHLITDENHEEKKRDRLRDSKSVLRGRQKA